MIKKGLKVRVLTGKDKKKEGEVIEIDRANNRAKVKEINMVKKHVKTTTLRPFLIIIKPPVLKKLFSFDLDFLILLSLVQIFLFQQVHLYHQLKLLRYCQILL